MARALSRFIERFRATGLFLIFRNYGIWGKSELQRVTGRIRIIVR